MEEHSESCSNWSVKQLSCCDESKAETVFCCSWKGIGVLACGLQDGIVKVFYETDVFNEKSDHVRTVNTGQNAAVSSLDWNVIGSHLAIGSSRNNVFIWETENDVLHTLIGHTGSISKVKWNHQGSRDWLLTASDDNFVILWNGIERTELQRFSHSDWIWDVHWISSDSLVSCCADKTVKVFQVNVSNPICNYVHEERVYSARVNDRGDRIATCLESGSTISVFSLQSNEPVAQLTGHNGRVFCLSWLPLAENSLKESNILASGSGDGTIRIWDTSFGNCIQIICQMGTIWEMAFSSNGEFLTTCVWIFHIEEDSIRGEITIFTTQAWNPIFKCETEYEPDDVYWNSDNSQLAISQCPEGKTFVDIINLKSSR